MSFILRDFVFSELYLEMNCDHNEGGSQTLVLRGNELVKKIGRRVKDSDLVNIIKFLRDRPQVVALDFPYNELSDCGLYTLCEFFIERPVIRHLNIIGNNITARGIGYLASLAEKFPLYSLRLTGNKIEDEGGRILSELLRKDTPLTFLDVSDTHQTMSGLAYLMTACMPNRGGSTMLKYIDLGRPLPQEYHQVPDAHAAEFVGQIIKDNTQLEEIHVQQYQFDFRDMEILLEGLLANKTLLCLDLNNNNIGDNGVDYLCQYLKTGPSLECLMIGANNFGDLGALSLSYCLPFSKIKLLDITNNRITDEGMINVFYTIRKVVELKALFLWGNKVTHKSLVVLQRLYRVGLLNENHTDISLYCADNKLHAAWNYQANRYTHRFYCVPDYGSPTLRKLLLNPQPPIFKPHIHFKYHVDKSEIGFPMCEWERPPRPSKYLDPI